MNKSEKTQYSMDLNADYNGSKTILDGRQPRQSEKPGFYDPGTGPVEPKIKQEKQPLKNSSAQTFAQFFG